MLEQWAVVVDDQAQPLGRDKGVTIGEGTVRIDLGDDGTGRRDRRLQVVGDEPEGVPSLLIGRAQLDEDHVDRQPPGGDELGQRADVDGKDVEHTGLRELGCPADSPEAAEAHGVGVFGPEQAAVGGPDEHFDSTEGVALFDERLDQRSGLGAALSDKDRVAWAYMPAEVDGRCQRRRPARASTGDGFPARGRARVAVPGMTSSPRWLTAQVRTSTQCSPSAAT